MHVYDVRGTMIGNFVDLQPVLSRITNLESRDTGSNDNIHVDYKFDVLTNANYTVLRIFKKKVNGDYQTPFVFAPNGAGSSSKSTLSMNEEYKYDIAINAGLFDPSTNKPRGILFIDGTNYQCETSAPSSSYPLTIDENGDLGYADRNVTAESLISSGIIYAVSGWGPILYNYTDDILTTLDGVYHNATNAQRQIIGQFGNGDYAIVTCEGRDYDHSDGWTIDEAVSVCKQLGLKFAYNLDGGGSTETVIGQKQINTIYEGSKGRIVPTYICFDGEEHNGTDDDDFYNRWSWSMSDGQISCVDGGLAYQTTMRELYIAADPNNTRKSFIVSRGRRPILLRDSSDNYSSSEYYPIPIPPTANTVTITMTPNTIILGPRIVKLENNGYTNIQNIGWSSSGVPITFTSGTNLFLSINSKYNSAGDPFSTNPTDIQIEFSVT